jgi:hypothetical protein
VLEATLKLPRARPSAPRCETTSHGQRDSASTGSQHEFSPPNARSSRATHAAKRSIRFKGETLALEDEYAGTISHAVIGSDELMLMEPVLGRRPDMHKQLEEVSKTFLAWEKLLERMQAKRKPRFVAYMFSTPRTTVREAKQFLTVAEAEVIDVEIPNERDRFIGDIRRIGLTNPANSHLS